MPSEAVVVQVQGIVERCLAAQIESEQVAAAVEQARKELAASIRGHGDAGVDSHLAAEEVSVLLQSVLRNFGDYFSSADLQEIVGHVLTKTRARARLERFSGDVGWFIGEQGPIALARTVLHLPPMVVDDDEYEVTEEDESVEDADEPTDDDVASALQGATVLAPAAAPAGGGEGDGDSGLPAWLQRVLHEVDELLGHHFTMYLSFFVAAISSFAETLTPQGAALTVLALSVWRHLVRWSLNVARALVVVASVASAASGWYVSYFLMFMGIAVAGGSIFSIIGGHPVAAGLSGSRGR